MAPQGVLYIIVYQSMISDNVPYGTIYIGDNT